MISPSEIPVITAQNTVITRKKGQGREVPNQNKIIDTDENDRSQLNDIYTIEHKSFRDKSTKRYNLQQLDGIISTYQKRLSTAMEGNDLEKMKSIEESLRYWNLLRGQLLVKVKSYKEEVGS